MSRFLLTTAVAVGMATAVLAQADPITTRRETMKGVGAATRTGGQMAKGEIPFDLAKAQDILRTYGAAAETYHTYFPDTSRTGGQTTAAPKIWESPEEFRAAFDRWGADIKKAAAETKDLESFKASFGTVTKACASCHNTYRIKT